MTTARDFANGVAVAESKRKFIIVSRHPARNQVAQVNGYYDKKSDFIGPVDAILKQFGWTLGAFDMPGDNGRTIAPIEDIETDIEVGRLLVTWYRMPSGNQYELVFYIT